jgi:exodeoxyribonuclease VII large subunit
MTKAAAYSLLELNQYIRRVISLNFDEPVWIECEISQASFSRGHWYLDLVQKDDNAIVAQCQAALWANVYYYLKRKSPIPPEEILKQGMSVKLKVNVDFHERYGLKLIIEDIDTSFTIGVLEMQRQAILQAIKEQRLIRKNAETTLPSVIQRLAVISSARAAGYQDFVRHLEENVYEYEINLQLYESAMQGQQVEAEVLKCLGEIEKASDQYDAVAIIRGGGSRMDLAAFDNLPLAVRIAHFPIPVLIGIGHEIDQSVLDLVCYRSLKTPTAVADFVVDHNAAFERQLEETAAMLKEEISYRLAAEKDKIKSMVHDLHLAVRTRMQMEAQKLEQARRTVVLSGQHQTRIHRQRLDHLHALLTAMDPDHVLARGYSITSYQGKAVTRADALKKDMIIQTTFHKGSIKSKVE